MSAGILGGGILASDVPQGTGILGGFEQFARDNQAAMLMAGGALLDGQGWGAAAQSFAQGMRQDEYTRRLKQAEAEKEQKKVKAGELATKYGLPAAMAADPDQVFSLVGQIETRNRTREPSEWDRLTQGLSADELNQAKRYRLGLDTKPASTDDTREYQFAKQEGYQGTFPQFLQTKRGGATNAPSGYAYGPDGKLAPIPGGPQDPDRDTNEPLPGELAARFGLANQYFKRFGGIETDLTSKDPKAVGAWDRLGFGESGAIHRDMKLGSEAMVRMLTGAGMNKEEAENEVKQYLPGPYDNAATVLDKQKRLRAALRDMQREALQGRRSRRQIESDYPAFPVEPYSSNVQRGPIGQNRATVGAAQRATQGQTRSGVTWSAR
jgi:hypothetical protein